MIVYMKNLKNGLCQERILFYDFHIVNKILLVSVLLVGCTSSAMTSEQWEAKIWKQIDKEKGLPCREIMLSTSNHYGACFRDFWNDYKKCAGVSFSSSGCLILQGRREEEKLAKPWCFTENCAELHEQDPVRYQTWP